MVFIKNSQPFVFSVFRTKLNTLLIFLIFLICFHSSRSQTRKSSTTYKSKSSLLWEISGNGLAKSSYLFGTFHMMCKDDIVFSKNLLDALHKADAIYLELDLENPANTIGAVKLMKMDGGETLGNLLSEGDYNRLKKFFSDSLNISLDIFQNMKPIFLETFLMQRMLGCKTVSGVEVEIMTLAKKDGKKIYGLETLAFQSYIFDNIPYREQAVSLLHSLDSLKANGIQLKKMISVYQSQQLDKIEKLLKDNEFKINDGLDVLLDKRNMNWQMQLKDILPQKSVFVAVGAAHLVGENGLISLLKKKGYHLKALANNSL